MLNVKYLKLLPKTEIIEREKNFNRYSRDQFFICLLFIHLGFLSWGQFGDNVNLRN